MNRFSRSHQNSRPQNCMQSINVYLIDWNLNDEHSTVSDSDIVGCSAAWFSFLSTIMQLLRISFSSYNLNIFGLRMHTEHTWNASSFNSMMPRSIRKHIDINFSCGKTNHHELFIFWRSNIPKINSNHRIPATTVLFEQISINGAQRNRHGIMGLDTWTVELWLNDKQTYATEEEMNESIKMLVILDLINWLRVC